MVDAKGWRRVPRVPKVGELLNTKDEHKRLQGRWRECGGGGGGCLPPLGASLCRDLTGTSGRERATTEGEKSRKDAHSVFHPTATFLEICLMITDFELLEISFLFGAVSLGMQLPAGIRSPRIEFLWVPS